MTQFGALLKPLQLKHLTIRNRVLSTAHAPSYGENGMPGERYQLYHEEKAKGGVGMTMFGGSSSVSIRLACDLRPAQPRRGSRHRLSPILLRPRPPAWRRHHVPDNAHGPANALGHRTLAADHLRVLGARVEHRSFPKAMEIEDIGRVVRDFGSAARRCRDGGLDGCELSYAGFHLVPQFWSPITNRRTDRYGGDLANRMRLG